MKHEIQRSTEAMNGMLLNPVLFPQDLRPSSECGLRPSGKQSERDMDIRFEERHIERERIARELHDTLFQGFTAASLHLSNAVDQVPVDSPAKSSLNRALSLMSRVLEEGRVVLYGLRSPLMTSGSLEQALASLVREFIPSPARVQVIVTGKSKALKPTFQEQICLIAREALLNAFRHSEATTIEVELEYRARSLSLAIRDNGRGMDPQEVRTRRDSHWGLLGMEERAKTLGAQLHIWSRRGSGTEVEVALPINSASQGHQLALGHQ